MSNVKRRESDRSGVWRILDKWRDKACENHGRSSVFSIRRIDSLLINPLIPFLPALHHRRHLSSSANGLPRMHNEDRLPEYGRKIPETHNLRPATPTSTRRGEKSRIRHHPQHHIQHLTVLALKRFIARSDKQKERNGFLCLVKVVHTEKCCSISTPF
jgi:hypothetical protein